MKVACEDFFTTCSKLIIRRYPKHSTDFGLNIFITNIQRRHLQNRGTSKKVSLARTPNTINWDSAVAHPQIVGTDSVRGDCKATAWYCLNGTTSVKQTVLLHQQSRGQATTAAVAVKSYKERNTEICSKVEGLECRVMRIYNVFNFQPFFRKERLVRYELRSFSNKRAVSDLGSLIDTKQLEDAFIVHCWLRNHILFPAKNCSGDTKR